MDLLAVVEEGARLECRFGYRRKIASLKVSLVYDLGHS